MATKFKVKKIKFPTGKRKEDMRQGYIRGFIEALRLQNGTPFGVSLRKTHKNRAMWAARAFENHWQQLIDTLGESATARTARLRNKDGSGPSQTFLLKLAEEGSSPSLY